MEVTGFSNNNLFYKRLSVIKRLTGVILLCLIGLKGISQKMQAITVHFKPVFHNQDIVLEDSSYLITGGNFIKFEMLKFYITNVQLLHDNKIIWKESNSFHLYDYSDSVHDKITLTTPKNIKYNQIQFNLGIDSVTNVSGALGGDLDPTKGMYWTWQSGYINFKLEGTCSLCSNPKKEFQFHVGGYQAPFNTLQTVSLKVNSNENTDVELELQKFIDGIDLSKHDHIMSPNQGAVFLSQLLVKCFSVK